MAHWVMDNHYCRTEQARRHLLAFALTAALPICESEIKLSPAGARDDQQSSGGGY